MAEPVQTTPHHISHNYIVFLSVAGVMTTLSTLTVVCRFLSRRLTHSRDWDDWTSVGALFFAYCFLITTAVVATVADAGYHIEHYSLLTIEKYLKIALANNLVYNASITLSKASVLLLYRRIFPVRSFLIATWVMAGLLVGYFLSAECGLIFAYNPIEAQWKIWLPHTNIDNKKFWLAMGIVNVLLDAIILCMPQTRIWKLHQTRKRKILLSLVFLLGSFVCVTSIVRIDELETVNVADLTYTFAIPGIWTLVEMNTSIICSCLPVLPVLFRYWHDGTIPGKSTTSSGGSSKFSFFRRSDKNEQSSSSRGYSDLENSSASKLYGSQSLATPLDTFQTTIQSEANHPQQEPKSSQFVHVQREFEIARQ